MAYGVLYEFHRTSTNGADMLITISQKDYTGEVKKRALGRAPIIKRDNNGHIYGTSCELYAECLVDGEFSHLYTSDAYEYKVEVYKNNTLIWMGYVSPELYSEPDIAPPYDVQIIATDGLGELKNYNFQKRGVASILDHLDTLMDKTGIETSWNVVSGLRYINEDGVSSYDKDILSVKIDLDHEEGNSYYDVLQNLLSSLNANITQHNGKYLIFRETDFINKAENVGIEAFDAKGISTRLPVASFGTMKSHQWWPVGQLSTVIEPAKNKVVLQSPNHYKDNVLNFKSWTKSPAADYSETEEAYVLPVAAAAISQTIDFGGSQVAYRLGLRVRARNVGASEEQQNIGVKVEMEGKTPAVGSTYWLVKSPSPVAGRVPKNDYRWSNEEGTIEEDLPTPSEADTASDAQDIDIVLPLYYNRDNARDFAWAKKIKFTIFNPQGYNSIYVYGVSLVKYEQIAGYEAAVIINNAAREEDKNVELSMSDAGYAPEAGEYFMTGIPMQPSGVNPITQWQVEDNAPSDYLTAMSFDYSRAIALPKMKYSGILNVPGSETLLPTLFLRDGTYYFPKTYSYDLYADEITVELLSVSAANVSLGSVVISQTSEATGTMGGATTGGGGGGGGSVSMPRDKEMSDTSDNAVENRVIKAYVDNLRDQLLDLWHIDEDGNLVTDKQVIINSNLIVSGDTSSGGEGQENPSVGGITGIRVNGTLYEDENADGIIDLGIISGGDVDLTDYYTKTEIDNKYITLQTANSIYQKVITADNMLSANFVSGLGALAFVNPSTTTGQFLRTNSNNAEWVTINKSTVGLGNVDNTKDSDKNVNSANQWNYTFVTGNLDNVLNVHGYYNGYVANNNISNNPFDCKAGHIVSFGGLRTLQLVCGYNASLGLYYRKHEDNGNWSSWKEIMTIDENGNYCVTKTKNLSGIEELTIQQLTISSGGASIKGDVTIDGNLIVKGDTSSGGTGQDTPSGGVTEEDVEQYLTNYVNDITTTGSGNVISSVSKSGKNITFTKGVTALTSHQYIYALTIKNSAGTIQTTYTPNSAEKSITLTKAMVGLSNVENKSSATIREEITASNVTTALGYTPYNSANFIKANIKSTLGISDWALAASKPSYTKTEVGLGNVENTKLSTWVGTDKITTLGTITSGTWNGSKIANAYLANNAMTIAGTSVSLGGSIETSTITAAQIGSGNSFYHSGNANKTSVAWNASSLAMNGALTGATTGTFSSKLTANTLVLSNTEVKAHLTFSRGGINYIHANQSGGGVAFVVNGSGITLANAQLIISSDNYVYCGTEGLAQLGLGGKRWKSVYSIDGSFSGDLTAGTFSTSSAVACGGRLRITADNSANNFGFLKSTWEASSNYGLMHIGTNEGGTSTITNAAYDKVAMSISRSVVGIGRQYSYDELKGYNDSNTRLYVDGNLVVTGDAASGSDIRFKDVIENKTIRIDDIANAPLFSFKWNDRDDDSIHLGTSAQYWESIAPELVSGKDFKTLNYASLGVAMGIALAKKSVKHEDRIKMLEEQVETLKEEIRRIHNGLC